ncbi:MBL fold metallo-hydrolase [Sansalvadorimonas verongulae]|uniref:MBL fold metallo-hydrolase n=1 Tax=Sansalvadorimonas verongulae TaxID=2172824 RepID=UPI0012BC972D|nr:MBL fold metallo-hydrolase [Sansalvadorimonas verongulae]MTI12430.1 MBL fold metallo-hydrolase [Sansalvadorimonas verongulae]
MSVRGTYSFTDGECEVSGMRVGRVDAGINTTFIVYRVGDTVIDCGPPNQWNEVQPFIEREPVRQLLITHHHEDHSGNASRIAALTGVTPLAPELAKAKLASGFKVPPLQRFIWGSPIPVQTDSYPSDIALADGSPVIPVHVPGHAKDLTVFFLPKQKWLFSGDLYLSKSLKMFRNDENLSELIDSIHRVLALDFEVLFCPHRGIVENGKAAMEEKLQNLVWLCSESQRLERKGLSLSAITRKVLGREEMISWLTGYNISRRNLIREALKVKL